MTVSRYAVSRLPLYRATLARIKQYGAATVFSCDIAASLGITAAQVRKDFSMFRFAGRKKVGYDVNYLLSGIDLLMGKNEPPRAVLCGTSASHIPLLAAGLPGAGTSILAAFDDAPSTALPGMPGIPVLPVDEMFSFIPQNRIAIGIIAAPAPRAQAMLDFLVLAGIHGILDLSGAQLKAPKRCIVFSVNVARELEKLAYMVAVTSQVRKRAAV